MLKSRIAREAFTLIEMLVVLAIIVILAALLMPSLQKALDSGRTIACMNTLKQIGVALHSYASENNNYAPQWPIHIKIAEAAGEKYVSCPGEGPGKVEVLKCAARPARNWGTAYNYGDFRTPAPYVAWSTVGGVTTYYSRSLSRVTRPSRTIFYGECSSNVASIGGNLTNVAIDWDRHDSTANFLFVDGHVNRVFRYAEDTFIWNVW